MGYRLAAMCLAIEGAGPPFLNCSTSLCLQGQTSLTNAPTPDIAQVAHPYVQEARKHAFCSLVIAKAP